MKTHSFKEIIKLIEGSGSVMLFTHVNMDGDALGSSLALCRVLRGMGKRCEILASEGDVPRFLKFMTEGGDEVVQEPTFRPELGILLDCATLDRIESRREVFLACEKKAVIDHHISERMSFDGDVTDPESAATALLVYELIKELGAPIDKKTAEALYVGILTDTGCFKYSNTDADVLGRVAELYSYGIESAYLCSMIYDSAPLEQLMLESLAVEKLSLFAGGSACISVVTLEERNALGCSYDLTDSCIDRIRSVEGVEIAAFVKEKEPGVYKVSLRSKFGANVGRVARRFGGGGHIKASGCTLYEPLEESLAALKEEIEKELDGRNTGRQ